MPRATAGERARLHDLFAELCAIPSPSGAEERVRERVADELRGFGAHVDAPDEAGNLLARVGPHGAPAVLLCAHLDTVPHGAVPIEPVLVDDGWENAHAAILGADNKAAVAVMLLAARRVAETGVPLAVELLLTVHEEEALAGAKRFDAARLRAPWGFVFHHATPIGEVVVAAPTLFRLAVELHGRAAHAGIRPEEGRSAIVAAARAIARLPHGRVDDVTTANVGEISGGAGGTNVVAERCAFLAEARSLDARRVEELVAETVDLIHEAANEPGAEVDVDVDVERLVDGFRLAPDLPALAVAEAALRSTGHAPTRIATGGASDANALLAAGLPCVNLANGTERAHEPTERVSVVALEGMLDVTLALLEESARALRTARATPRPSARRRCTRDRGSP